MNVWLDSSATRAVHMYRGDHTGSDAVEALPFFALLFHLPTLDINGEDLFFTSLKSSV